MNWTPPPSPTAQRSRRTRFTVFLTVAAVSGLPDAATAASQPPTRRDSAGVLVVRNQRPQRDRAYLIDSVQRLTIGGAAADPADDLTGTVSVVRLRDGRIVVASGGNSSVRIYDSSGRRLAAVGRKGQGPGEFERMTWLGRIAADTILVFDAAQRRLTVLEPDGRLVRTIRPEAGAGAFASNVFGAFGDGRVLVLGPAAEGPSSPQPVMRVASRLLVTTPGSGSTVVGEFAGTESRVSTLMKDGKVARAYVTQIPFGRRGHWAVVDTLVLAAENTFFGFSLRTPTGRLVMTTSRPHQPRPVTEADVAAHIAAQTGRLRGPEDERSALVARIRETTVPSHKPAFDRILVRTNGEVWIREFLEPYDRERPGTWSVFSPTGVWLTDVIMPIGFEPKWIDQNEIVGTWLDANDVMEVRVHGLKGR